MCDYFDEGYKILYSFGESEIKNIIELSNFVEGLLKGGNKVLIAVDNAHTERTSAIFYLIDQLSNFDLRMALRFIMTARIPEFDWLVNDRLNQVEEAYRQSIRKFNQDPNLRHEIEPFTKNEIEQFVKQYGGKTVVDDKQLSQLVQEIIDETKGHPIMVKFYALGNGLGEDVRDRYYRYLIDPLSGQPDSIKIETMLACSLLDIANLPITDTLLENLGYLDRAYELDKAILHQYSEELWTTIHPRWDTELLSFLYNEKNRGILLKRKEYLKKALDSIFSLKDGSITTAIIQTIYDIASVKIIPTNIIIQVPDYLGDRTKCGIYVHAMASAYRRVRIPNEMLDKCDKALDIDPNNADAWANKGWALHEIKKYDDAIGCLDKTIEIDHDNSDAWFNKGWTLSTLGKRAEASGCFNRCIELEEHSAFPLYIKTTKIHDNIISNRIRADKLVNIAFAYAYENRHDEALELHDKAIEIDPNNFDAWYNKGWVLSSLERHDEALKCHDKAIEMDPNSIKAWSNKAWTLSKLGRHDEALKSYDKAIEMDPNSVDALYSKSFILITYEGKLDEAIECCNKIIEKDPNHPGGWYNRACARVRKGQVENGLKDLEKAIEIGKEEYVEMAEKDSDFVSLKNDECFISMIKKTKES